MPGYEEALKLSKAENEGKKQEAIDACVEQHEKLMACFQKASIFNGCFAESRAFWECYEHHRGFQKTKLQAFLDRNFSKQGGADPKGQ